MPTSDPRIQRNVFATNLRVVLVLWTFVGLAGRTMGSGGSSGKTTGEQPYTPLQTTPPRSGTQFNPDPGTPSPIPAVQRPTPKPLPHAPVPIAVVKPAPEPNPTVPVAKPQAANPSGTLSELPSETSDPFQTRPTVNPVNSPATPQVASQKLDATGAPMPYPGDETGYTDLFGPDPMPQGLGNPRRGVRSRLFGTNIFHYREYALGREAEKLPPNTEAVPNRWQINVPPWRRYMDPTTETPYGRDRSEIKLWHPYEQSLLKGDAPILGTEEIFLNITARNFSIGEYRRLPVPSGVSAAAPNSSEFYGRGEQFFFSNDTSLSVELFRGETAFKPVEWLFRVTAVHNENWIFVREQNLIDPDPRGPGASSRQEPNTGKIGAAKSRERTLNPVGTGNSKAALLNPGDAFNYLVELLRSAGDADELNPVNPNTQEVTKGKKRRGGGDREKDFARTKNTRRHKDFFALQEAFLEIHLGDKSDNYDFMSSKWGIQPFVSDFRGFIFYDTNLGARIFGNWNNNRIQYNLVAFDMREKDTYSGLNTFDPRDQKVFIANVYHQDFIWKGYTAQLSLHGNVDQGRLHYDKNDIQVRPAQLGVVLEPHNVEAYYLGWAGDGHIGRLNLSHAAYWVLGQDEKNGLAGRKVDINAQMAAAELSIDYDWIRYKLSLFWASGDNDPTDRTARGFDTILDNPFFIGGPFSYYVHQGINLGGTGINLKNPDSLIPSLRSSKTEGQANFVNPGVKIVSVGMDFDVTPKLRALCNASYIWLDDTAPIERALFTNKVSDRLGWDINFGLKYRPLLTDNIVIGCGVGFFFPDDGFKDIYRRSQDLVPGYGPQDEAGLADRVLWNAVLTMTLTY